MVSPELIVIKRWTWKQFTSLIVTIVLVLSLFYVIGYIIGIKDGINLKVENEQLTTTVNEIRTQLDERKRQLVMQEQISKVDQAANLHSGNSMDSQHQQIRELERELNFFRSIMAPEESIKGLQISRFNWQQQEQNTFSWQLSLIQAGAQGNTVSGYVNIELIAMRGQDKVVLPLLTEEQSDRFNYRFRYFQHITGITTIAADLTPVSVAIVARPTLKGQPSIEKQFPWQSDEEKVTNVE